MLDGLDGILVAPGFGSRGIEGKIAAVRYARENKIPFFGICLGMQMAVIEFARNVCGLKGANSTEFDPHAAYPVVDLMPDQRDVTDKGATMRLGAYPVRAQPGTKARRRLRRARDQRAPPPPLRGQQRLPRRAGAPRAWCCLGQSPDRRLVEMIELPNHPYFVGCQFHPEFKSRPQTPHPLFRRSSRPRCAPGWRSQRRREQPTRSRPRRRLTSQPRIASSRGGSAPSRIAGASEPSPAVRAVIAARYVRTCLQVRVPHGGCSLYRRRSECYKRARSSCSRPRPRGDVRMSMEMKQHLKLSQQLVMTPQLQQAIKLLQLSRMELVDLVREEMLENPILEDGGRDRRAEQAKAARRQDGRVGQRRRAGRRDRAARSPRLPAEAQAHAARSRPTPAPTRRSTSSTGRATSRTRRRRRRCRRTSRTTRTCPRSKRR